MKNKRVISPMGYYGPTYRIGFGGGMTQAVKTLIIANIAVFLLQHIFGTSFGMLLIRWFGLVPLEVHTHFTLWQFFTYMFLHGQGNILHLLLNMFILWVFGCEVERAWGPRGFFKYYLICGVGAGVFHLLFNWGSMAPVVGASGAIYGIMAAFAILFPDRVITLLLFFVFPVNIKAKHLVLIFAGISLFAGFWGTDSGIAHLAHLGGMVVGYLYLKGGWKVELLGEYWRRRKTKKRMAIATQKRQKIQQIRDEIDTILDKINEVGYENLTEREKRILKEHSQLLSREKET